MVFVFCVCKNYKHENEKIKSYFFDGAGDCWHSSRG